MQLFDQILNPQQSIIGLNMKPKPLPYPTIWIFSSFWWFQSQKLAFRVTRGQFSNFQFFGVRGLFSLWKQVFTKNVYLWKPKSNLPLKTICKYKISLGRWQNMGKKILFKHEQCENLDIIQNLEKRWNFDLWCRRAF